MTLSPISWLKGSFIFPGWKSYMGKKVLLYASFPLGFGSSKLSVAVGRQKQRQALLPSVTVLFRSLALGP